MAVNTDPVLNFNSIAPIKDTTASTFAVMDFGSPSSDAQQSGAGVSSADTFYISLSQRNIKIIERERIKRITAEQDVIRGNKALSDQEKAQRIGRLAGADFMIFGAITEYKSEVRDVELGMFIPENERERYQTDYQAYQRASADYQQGMATYMREYQEYRLKAARRGMRTISSPVVQQQRPPEMVKSLEQWEDELANRRGRRELATVASIGLTSRVIDVRTGQIIWVGQGAKRHLQLQEGMQILINRLVETMLQQPGTPAQRR
jgi:hypothetical protein